MPNGTAQPQPPNKLDRGALERLRRGGRRLAGPLVVANGLAGVQPRPLPAQTAIGAALSTAQARDRFAEQTAGASPTGMPGAPGEPVLLELPTRSYTMPEETEEERERKRQTEMLRTMERFVYPTGAPEAVEEAPRPEEAPAEEEEEEAPSAAAGAVGPAGPAATEQARAEREAMRLQQLQGRSRLQEAKQRLAAEVSKRFRSKKLENLKRLQNIWRAVDAGEIASSESVVPLLFLVLQLNVQVINKWVFPKSDFIPPTAFWEDVGTGCLDCGLCCSMLMQFVQIIFPLALLAAIAVSAAGAIDFLGGLLKGLF